MKSKIKPRDADIRGELAALCRAAWKLARQTNTPFHVWMDGRIVNLNPGARRAKSRGRGARAT